MNWLSRLLGRGRLERQLDAELKHHLDEDARRLEAEGRTPAEARRLALARFGGLEPIKEQARDARGTRWLEDLARDTRYALRLMRRSPMFTLAAVGSLAIGIGANTAVFSNVDALLLRALPVAAPDELHFIEKAIPSSTPNQRFSYPLLRSFQEQIPEARFGGASSPVALQLTIDGASELAVGQLVSGTWFDVLGLRPQAGRLLTPEDDAEGRPPVVVISDAFWTRRFGRDPSVLGRAMRLNGIMVSIVGVAPAAFDGLIVGTPLRLWAPASQQQSLRVSSNASNNNADARQPWVGQHGIQWLTVVVRLPGGVAASAIEPRLASALRQSNGIVFGDAPPDALARRLSERPWLVPGARGLSPLRQSFSAALWVLMATVALVLLVACANLASLLLARNTARTRELTVRLAIGARRGRLVRQLLTESLILAALGGVAGLALARWAAPMLPRLALNAPPTSMPLQLPLDTRLLVFAFGVSLLTGVLFGLAPALRWSRPGVHDALRLSQRVIGGRQRFGRSLVVVQVALALVLLVGATLFARTFRNYLALDPGFEREHVVSARFDPRLAAIDEARLPALYARLLEEAGRVPGVRSATLAVVGPASGAARISDVTVAGYTPPDGGEATIHEDHVGPRYFETIAMPLRAGRDFTDRDDDRAPPVAIINETMARRYFGARDPLGQRFGYSADNLNFLIVGVVADARVNGLREAVPPMAYFPLAQNLQQYVRNVYVRAAGSPDAVRGGLRAAIAAADPDLAVREVVTLGELAARSITQERLISTLMGAFSGLALLVACLGLYGTLSYAVARRTNEIGVRLALGASPGLVRGLVLRESAVLVTLGCALGLAAGLSLVRYTGALLFGLSPYDVTTFVVATGIVLAVSLLASAAPAWRASRVDPLTALRSE